MQAAVFLGAAVTSTVVLKIRKDKLSQAPPAKKYTCCVDGSTDCPCSESEKSIPPPQPKLAPLKVTIEPGKSVWACTCGQSKNYPYCDGSHKAYNIANKTKFAPTQVTNTEGIPKDYYLCQCGHSAAKPFCDGSHRKIKPVA